jgi:hypothetical protein
VEKSRFSISVLLDFAKTIDSMSDDLLLHKLKFRFGISSNASLAFWDLGLVIVLCVLHKC